MSVIYKNNGPIYLTQEKFDALVTKVPGQEYCIITDDEYATLTQLSAKLDIAQGTDKAGMFMKVGTDGNLTPAAVTTYQQLPADLCKPNIFTTFDNFMTAFTTNHSDLDVKGNCLIGSIKIGDGPSYDGGGEIILHVFTDTSVEEIGHFFVVDFYSNSSATINHWHTIYQNGAQVSGWIGGIQRIDFVKTSAYDDGQIYQYVGPTDSNYTKGYFYKCTVTRGTLTCTGTNIEVLSDGDHSKFNSKVGGAVSGATYTFVATGTEGQAATGLTLNGTAVTLVESSVSSTLQAYGVIPTDLTAEVITGATVGAVYTADEYSWDQIDVQPKSASILKDEEGFYFEYESDSSAIDVGTIDSMPVV